MRPTELSDSGALIDQLVAMVGEASGDELDGVGVGVPSVVEFETGRVVSSVNVPLADVPLRQVLGERLGVPVFVDNDATVAALAEAHDEELRLVARNLVMLTIGTGVGGGLVLGGRIYRGSTGGAGELGHTIVGLDLDGDDPVADARRVPAAGIARVRGRRATRSTGSRREAGELVPGLRARAARGARAKPVPVADAVERRAPTATRSPRGSSRSGPSGSASGSPTRSTRSTPTRS